MEKDAAECGNAAKFGEASSPVVHGDFVVLNHNNDSDSRILVFDARTGDLRWEAKREEKSAWATPLIVEHRGGRNSSPTPAIACGVTI